MINHVRDEVLKIAKQFSKDSRLSSHLGSEYIDLKIAELGIDSLSKLEMVMKLEERLSIELPEEDLLECETMGQLIKLCEGLFKQR